MHAEYVAPDATDQEVVRGCEAARSLVPICPSLHHNRAHVVLARASRESCSAEYRNGCAGRAEADPSAEERKDVGRFLGRGGNLKEARVLEKELALFREQDVESGQVHLLLVRFNL